MSAKSLCILVTLLALASPGHAHFLFVRVLPHAEAGRFAEVFFSDRPDTGDPTFIDKIAATELWLQRAPGDFQPLRTIKTHDRLRALVPSTGSFAVVGRCDYGVLARARQPAFLLRHFPGALAGDPKRLNELLPRKDLPLQIACRIEGDVFHFTPLRDGKPIPHAQLTLLGTSPKSTTLTAGADGQATWKALPGSFALYMGQTLKQPGVHQQTKYDEIRDFCSLAFQWPLQHDGPDSEALALFREAIAARASWTKFPGFSADVEAYVDGRRVTGSVSVSATGDVSVDTLEEAVSPWIKDRLDSIVLHRLAAPMGASTPTVYFGDQETAHPLGRLVIFDGGKFASSYRIKDKQLMVVNRHLGKTNMTITILENDITPAGKVLPHSYTVQSWDAATGQLRRSETVQERWQRVAELDLPASYRVTESSEAGVSVKTLQLSRHKLR